jgi:hypothetical protein
LEVFEVVLRVDEFDIVLVRREIWLVGVLWLMGLVEFEFSGFGTGLDVLDLFNILLDAVDWILSSWLGLLFFKSSNTRLSNLLLLNKTPLASPHQTSIKLLLPIKIGKLPEIFPATNLTLLHGRQPVAGISLAYKLNSPFESGATSSCMLNKATVVSVQATM